MPGTYSTSDTIVAIATPPGTGGVGIVRVSGSRALDIGRTVFQSRLGKRRQALPSHRMLHGYVVDGEGLVVDEALCCFMAAPRSYTAEDVLELHGHGGPVVLRRIVERCIETGARPAEPGEFTLRAFLNGRLDLAQAEAVADVIAARSEAAVRIAQRQLRGDLSHRLAAVRAPLLALLAHCEAVVDFAEEGVPDLQEAGAVHLLDDAESALTGLLESARAGRAIREGIRVAIIGRPNVGKSSLLNALVRADRAIVAPFPGTTRDTVDETITLGGIPVTFVDTAGIQSTDDAVERIGIERAWRALSEADLALLVLDRSMTLQQKDFELLSIVGRDTRLPAYARDGMHVFGNPPGRDKTRPRSQPLEAGYPRQRMVRIPTSGNPPFRPSGEEESNGSTPSALGDATGDRETGESSSYIVVANKCDLVAAWEREAIMLGPEGALVETSTTTGVGLAELEEAVQNQVLGRAMSGEDEPALSHLRHIRRLERCREQLAAARRSIDIGLSPDFTATDLREALESVYEVTGEQAGEALLDEIFRTFCIGK